MNTDDAAENDDDAVWYNYILARIIDDQFWHIVLGLCARIVGIVGIATMLFLFVYEKVTICIARHSII